jgi:outer membrane receptor protein involved in Fe transport
MTRSKRRKMQYTNATGAMRSVAHGVPLASAALLAAMSAAYGQTASTGGLEEIVVTAQKRQESLQDVPLAVQAFSTARLDELNVQKFEDFVRFLPSVSIDGGGPGNTNIYMRGVVSGGDGNHSASLPSVGIYLDEQPITTIGGALDVHMYDIARVEALAGPQGTLFGASSQSGTVRIITNKPDPTGFDAGYGVELNTVSGGSEGYLGEGFVNIPLNERTAIRLVGWARRDGGFVDNIPYTRPYPTFGILPDNSKLVEDDYNDVDTYGARAALRFDINDSWTVTPTVMGQVQEVNGDFVYDRTLGEIKVSEVRPDYVEDRWMQAALTVEGKIANFDLVYAGAYMFRDVDSAYDYSEYSYWYDSLYAYGNYWLDNDGNPIDISQYVQAQNNFTRVTQEIRLVSPAEERFRYTVGAFFQRSTHSIEERYLIDDLADASEVTGWPDTIWLTQQDRTDEDTAIFGQADFDLTDKLTLTAGLRYFWVDNSLKGFFGYGLGYSDRDPPGAGSTDPRGPGSGEDSCILREPFGPAGPNFDDAPCLNVDKGTKEDDYSIKLSASYKLTDDKLLYATYAEGFRPGGINRRGTLPPYLSDWLNSYEIGWKTAWADNRLLFNGAVFYQEWEDFQFPILGQNGLTEIKNAAQAEIWGVEADIAWQPTDRLNLTAGVSFLNSELAEPYCGYTFPGTSTPVAQQPCPVFDDDGNPTGEFQDPEAPNGQSLPLTPDFKGNITARYEFPLMSYASYARGALVYVGERESSLLTFDRDVFGKIPAYTTLDLAFGLGKDSWNAELYVANAFDERGENSRGVECVTAVCGAQVYSYIIYPRTIGLRFSQEF